MSLGGGGGGPIAEDARLVESRHMTMGLTVAAVEEAEVEVPLGYEQALICSQKS